MPLQCPIVLPPWLPKIPSELFHLRSVFRILKFKYPNSALLHSTSVQCFLSIPKTKRITYWSDINHMVSPLLLQTHIYRSNIRTIHSYLFSKLTKYYPQIDLNRTVRCKHVFPPLPSTCNILGNPLQALIPSRHCPSFLPYLGLL